VVKKTLVYWRDMPSQVIVQRGRTRKKVLLSQRFQDAIDRAAMRAGKGSSNAYLEEWRRESSTMDTNDDLQEMADREAACIEADFSDDRLLKLIRNHGAGSA